MISAALFAHHGTFVSYDTSKPMTMKATVTEFHYTNPHMQLYFDVKDENGNVTHWSGEGPDPAVLVQVGWGRKRTQAALAPGREITITVNPARNGKPVGEIKNVVNRGWRGHLRFLRSARSQRLLARHPRPFIDFDARDESDPALTIGT